MLQRARPRGFWQSVTGSLREGEDPRGAALRELEEETGIRPAAQGLIDCGLSNRFPILPAWRERYHPDDRYNSEHVFRYRLPARRPVRLHSREHVAYRWLDRAQAAALASSWTNRIAILAFAPARGVQATATGAKIRPSAGRRPGPAGS